MTVKELIEFLSKCDPDKTVTCCGDEFDVEEWFDSVRLLLPRRDIES